jgi:hypothetical protein
MSEKKPYSPAQSVYTPVDAMHQAVEYVEQVANLSRFSIPFPIPIINEYFAPMWAGQVSTVVAQTSHYKTGILDLVARGAAEYLQQTGRENEAIVQVVVEESIEEKGISELGRVSGLSTSEMSVGRVQDWDRLRAAAIEVSGIPVYRIGDSLLNPDMSNHLYLSNVLRCLRFMQDELKISIALVTLDYLQALPPDPEAMRHNSDQQRRLQVRQDMYRIKKTAKWLNCPLWLGCQAKQLLSGARGQILIPGIYDAEETSSIAQHTDRMLSLWMPKMTHPLGSEIEYGNLSFRVTEDLLFIRVTKQKGGLPSGKTFMCKVNFERGRVQVEQLIDRRMG